jgi:hypothetical protein
MQTSSSGSTLDLLPATLQCVLNGSRAWVYSVLVLYKEEFYSDLYYFKKIVI